jgi:hypothetical protein
MSRHRPKPADVVWSHYEFRINEPAEVKTVDDIEKVIDTRRGGFNLTYDARKSLEKAQKVLVEKYEDPQSIVLEGIFKRDSTITQVPYRENLVSTLFCLSNYSPFV